MANFTSLKVKNARPGTYGDGKGLYLRVKPSGSRSWILRVQHQGRRQDIGLGSVDDVSLAEARDSASRLRRIARLGNDAIAERDRGKIRVEIGRAHVGTPVTNANLVCRLLLDKKKPEL